MNAHISCCLAVCLSLVLLAATGCHGVPSPDGTRDDGGFTSGDAAVAGPGYCPGFTVDPRAKLCRMRRDCNAALDEECVPPGTPPACGTPQQCEHQCAGDSDCTMPGAPVCVPTNMPCCVRPGTRCEPRCTADSCMANEERCNPSGHCEPIPCTAGYTCPHSAACTTGAQGADAHGCVRRSCQKDSECDCGACVQGACYDGPGVCMPPAA